MQKINIVILIIVLINLIWTGLIFQDFSKNLGSIGELVEGKTEFVKTVEDLRDSKLVERFTFVTAGDIKKIEDNVLTLGSGDSILEVSVATDAQIVSQESKEAIPEMISFLDLKVGDDVSCLVEMGKDGVWAAYRVKVMIRQ
ncbi:MAG: hypothetical protein ABID67_00180 [Candidatus Nealsonbacteria bacterium]